MYNTYYKNYKVIFLVKSMQKYWNKVLWKVTNKSKNNFYESNLLKLNINKAKIKLTASKQEADAIHRYLTRVHSIH